MKKISIHYSNTWQTTIMVVFVVFVSIGLTIWLFWRSLYLPELKSHARYLATELAILDEISKNSYSTSEERHRLRDKMHTQFIADKEKFPEVRDKIVAGFFTDIIEEEIHQQLNREVVVYFEFKPSSQLWIQDSNHKNYWILEPVVYYSQYNPVLFVSLLLGFPIFSIISIILLTRQLNRPLRRLQKTANDYNQYGQATILPTQQGTIEIREVNTAFNRLFTSLSQAQKERTIMLAGISHDLRTPLTRMRLTAEMLPDEFLREGLIYDIDDMNAILEQFISFMKDGSDEPVDLTDLGTIIHEIMVQFAPLEIHYDDDEKLPLIPLRSLSIKRLIINLINNAERYGKPPIYILTKIVPITHENYQQKSGKTFIVDENNTKQKEVDIKQVKEELIISIQDCGEGIKESDLERIIQPFERGETARTSQGSGLGLAIVNRIAQLHHGYIEIITTPNNGGLQVNTHIPLFTCLDTEKQQ